jgi:hypothetical protein
VKIHYSQQKKDFIKQTILSKQKLLPVSLGALQSLQREITTLVKIQVTAQLYDLVQLWVFKTKTNKNVYTMYK